MDPGRIPADLLPIHYPVATAADLAFYKEYNSYTRKIWLNSFLTPESGFTHGYLCSFRQQLILSHSFRIPQFLADRKVKYSNLDQEFLDTDIVEKSYNPHNWRRYNKTKYLLRQQLRLWKPQTPTTNYTTAIPSAVE